MYMPAVWKGAGSCHVDSITHILNNCIQYMLLCWNCNDKDKYHIGNISVISMYMIENQIFRPKNIYTALKQICSSCLKHLDF